MKDSSNLWLNQLFDTFTNSSQVELYFEADKKLQHQDTILNLSIHPIRFADDIFFNFYTNSDQLRDKLRRYEVDYRLFYHQADIIKATYLKSVKKEKIEESSLLLIGQTERDKVLFDGSKYLSLLDYIDEIKKVAKRYNKVYFKPHPYAKNSKKIYRALKKELGNMEIVYDNIYHLLSSRQILHVCAINSSVLYEAKYFKKDVTFLHKPTFDFHNQDIGVYGDYFCSTFWSDILDVEDKGVTLPFVPNRLRKSLNDFWGYNTIDNEIILKDIVKSKIRYLLHRYL